MMNRLLALVLVLTMCLFALPAFAAAQIQAKTVIVQENTVPDDTSDDNDERHMLYLQKALFHQEGISVFGTAARARLNDTQKAWYDTLKAGAEQIAAGTRDSALFEVTRTFTAAELGFSDFLLKDENGNYVLDENGYGQFDPAVLEIIEQELYGGENFDQLLEALLSDCPYELYWFDKTIGMKSNTSMSGGPQSITCKMDIYFVVAKKFRGSDEYHVNTSVTSAAAATETAAKAIVAKYKDASDYEKLLGYKNEICNLVSYDKTAADTGNYFSAIDSNPWQVVHVFDGNTSTNVVCEGYAKAFQYLCDLTDFNNDSIYCYSVTGDMVGGTGAGGHMWNIVTMEDGKNYLVDVTNCDSGTIGSPDKLFMNAPTSGSVSQGYTFALSSNIDFDYDEETLALWGTDSDTILKLAGADYTPGTSHTCSFSWKDGNATTATHHTLTCTCGETQQEAHSWTYTASGNAITAACEVCSANGGKVSISAPSDLVYSGSAKEAKVNSTISGVYPNVAYTGNLTDGKPVKAGKYTASITLGGQTVSVEYTVTQKALKPTVVLEETDYTYDGTSKSPSVTVMDGDIVVEPYEYNVYRENNIKAGRAIVRVEDRNSGGNYALDPVVVEFTIKQAELTDDMVSLAADSVVYTGVELEPAVTVSSPATTEDYDVSYTNNKEVGTATVTVTGKNNYTGTVEKTFKITAHEHKWAYSVSNNVITAVCSGEGNCEIASKTATVTVTGGAHEYDGTVKQATVTQNPADTFSGVKVTYHAEPLNAGAYTASIALGGVTATDTLTINPKPAQKRSVSLYRPKRGYKELL